MCWMREWDLNINLLTRNWVLFPWPKNHVKSGHLSIFFFISPEYSIEIIWELDFRFLQINDSVLYWNSYVISVWVGSLWAYDRGIHSIPLAQSHLTLMLRFRHSAKSGSENHPKTIGIHRLLNVDMMKLKEQKRKHTFIKVPSDNLNVKCHGQ